MVLQLSVKYASTFVEDGSVKKEGPGGIHWEALERSGCLAFWPKSDARVA